MKLAMDETNRRRTIQTAFNEANGITPKGVSKRIKDIIDGVYDVEDGKRERKAAQEQANYESLSEKQLTKELKRIEKAMHDAAKNLEFERPLNLEINLRNLSLKFLALKCQI